VPNTALMADVFWATRKYVDKLKLTS